MKIVHVLHHFPAEPTGGTERSVLALGLAMRDAGHDVTVIAGSLDVGPSNELLADEVLGLRVFRIRREDVYFESWEKSWSPAVGAAFAALLDRLAPDVVHVHHWIRLTTDLVRIAAQREGVVVACTLHDYWTQLAIPTRPVGVDLATPPPASPWVNAAERDEAFAFHRADLLDEVRSAHLRFAPSRAHADGVQQLALGPLGPVVVTPPPLLAVPSRLRHRTAPRGRTLLMWGSIYPEKGIDVAIDALASVGGWRLVVLGEFRDDTHRQRTLARCARLPVEFRGRFDAVDLAAVDADFALIPALSHESYGLVVDEARCLGLPLIASDLPAFREHADLDATAFFAAGDPGSLAMLLLDGSRLDGLADPRPGFEPVDRAASVLLDGYAAAQGGQHRRFAAVAECTDAMRAAMLFRRAERRLWSALQRGTPPLPPDGYLRP